VADHTELEERVAAVEARLAALNSERGEVQAELLELRRSLALEVRQSSSATVDVPAVAPTMTEMGNEEKIALFRSLFRGRVDVFPKYWLNSKSGKRGYSPACSNEWVRGVCDKPRVKCGDCTSQAFIHVSDEVVRGHLQGHHTIGVYPLLADDRCWFLALDFDKGDWQQDVEAFRETSESLGLRPAIERSRSGNGAHAWFFFSEPIAAIHARQMGSFLITETMSRRHELSMASYDRLFPNQDTLPRGGFGNLIALPLQHEAREEGNSVFVDVSGTVLSDQWAYLASLPRLRRDEVVAIAEEAKKNDQVVGIQMSEDAEEAAERPWATPSVRLRKKWSPTAPLPPRIRVVLAGQLFVEKAGLESGLVNQIKRLAAFQNPEFFKRQAMRLSMALTPRVIACAEDLTRYVALPRGCKGALEDLLQDLGIELLIEDERNTGEALDLKFHGELSSLQCQVVESMVPHDIGVLVAPPGSGKTVMGIHLAALRGRNTLVLVHRKQLLEQWRAQLALFLDIAPTEIGQLGGGKRKLTGKIDIAMIQSLARAKSEPVDLANYGHVIVDECHHVPAVSFERVMKNVAARFITGLTATPKRRDGHDRILDFQLGPIRHTVAPADQAALRQFAHELIVRQSLFEPPDGILSSGIQGLYGALARDDRRNELIINDVIQALEAGRSPLVLTERREHLELLEERLRPMARNVIVLRGGMGVKQMRRAMDLLVEIPDDEERLLLATGRFIGEGFDDARLDTLFLTMPVSWKGTLVQYVGRLHRMHQNKSSVRIYDYLDARVTMLARMFEKRLRGYSSMGYRRRSVPDDSGSPSQDYILEYDQEELRVAEFDVF
jgi:superfamily II DNA or RNA helicase